MLYSILLIATTALSGLVSAQNTTGPLIVDPGSVDLDLRYAWCRAQRGNCPLICGGSADPNSCDEETLTYECVCTDGSHPNISSYSATLPSYICEEYISQCVERAGDDLGLLTDCRSITCGTRNASSVAASNGGGSSGSASSASASASATSGSTGTGSGSAASETSSEGAAIALSVAKSYGTGILAGGLLAVFGLAL